MLLLWDFQARSKARRKASQRSRRGGAIVAAAVQKILAEGYDGIARQSVLRPGHLGVRIRAVEEQHAGQQSFCNGSGAREAVKCLGVSYIGEEYSLTTLVLENQLEASRARRGRRARSELGEHEMSMSSG